MWQSRQTITNRFEKGGPVLQGSHRISEEQLFGEGFRRELRRNVALREDGEQVLETPCVVSGEPSGESSHILLRGRCTRMQGTEGNT